MKESIPSRYGTLTITLTAVSLVLLAAAVLMIQDLSIAYGLGAGAAIQSNATKVAIASILQQYVGQIASVYTAILIEYVAFIAALGMFVTGMLLYRRRLSLGSADTHGYTILHGTLVLIYVLLFMVNRINAPLRLSAYYLAGLGAAVAVAVAIDAYLVFSRYVLPYRAERVRGSIQIDPLTPYSNLIRMKDDIFSKLTGSVGVVDKHMNSVGIENLHRLIQGNLGTMTEINILTSSSMLDNDFWKNYLDCKSEVENAGTKLNVMVMSDDDSTDQHERFIFDDKVAYKVPPFNIIHKKSEHITRIKVADAKRRFDRLYSKSIKYENFLTRLSQEKQK